MDAVNIRLSRVGGLTAAREMRDLCVAMGIAMTIEDRGGGDSVKAAIAHLAHSTPEAFRFSVSDCNSYVTTALADGAPQRADGRMRAPVGPGLGIAPRSALLGKPVLTIGRHELRLRFREHVSSRRREHARQIGLLKECVEIVECLSGLYMSDQGAGGIPPNPLI